MLRRTGSMPLRDRNDLYLAAGYAPLGYFVLPESDWWDGYYEPIERRLAELRPALENGIDVHLVECASLVDDGPLRDELDSIEQGLRLLAAMGLDHGRDNAHAVALGKVSEVTDRAMEALSRDRAA